MVLTNVNKFAVIAFGVIFLRDDITVQSVRLPRPCPGRRPPESSLARPHAPPRRPPDIVARPRHPTGVWHASRDWRRRVVRPSTSGGSSGATAAADADAIATAQGQIWALRCRARRGRGGRCEPRLGSRATPQGLTEPLRGGRRSAPGLGRTRRTQSGACASVAGAKNSASFQVQACRPSRGPSTRAAGCPSAATQRTARRSHDICIPKTCDLQILPIRSL